MITEPVTRVSDTVTRWLATVGGVGNIPLASGTFGTVPALAAVTLLVALLPAAVVMWAVPALALVITLIGIPVATRAEVIFAERDSGRVVIDEVAGYFWTVAFLPLAWPGSFVLILLLGFVLFRLFDVWKPFPIDWLQKLPGGYGVVLDDVLAGIYANIALRLVLRVLQ